MQKTRQLKNNGIIKRNRWRTYQTGEKGDENDEENDVGAASLVQRTAKFFHILLALTTVRLDNRWNGENQSIRDIWNLFFLFWSFSDLMSKRSSLRPKDISHVLLLASRRPNNAFEIRAGCNCFFAPFLYKFCFTSFEFNYPKDIVWLLWTTPPE